MISLSEYEEWQNLPYSTVEKACYRVSRDRKGRLRPNAKAAIESLMACIGTYGPAGWGLGLDEACRIAIKEANSICTYEDLWSRSKGSVA